MHTSLLSRTRKIWKISVQRRKFCLCTFALLFIAVIFALYHTGEFLLPTFRNRRRERIAIWNKYMENITDLEEQKRLPDVIIIGAEKCGTGALVRFLNEHPSLKASSREQFFFTRVDYHMHIKNYLEAMPFAKKHEHIMEKTPGYLKFAEIPSRIHKTLPHAKILLMLCDPVNRTYSDFMQHIKKNQIENDEDFDKLVREILAQSDDSYMNQMEHILMHDLLSKEMARSINHIVTAGLYYYYIKPWLELYTLNENFLILDGEEFLIKPWITLREVENFLQVPKLFTEDDFKRQGNAFYCVRKWSLQVDNEEYKCLSKSKGRSRLQSKEWNPEPLKKFFAPSNEKLYELIGKKFQWQ